MCNDETIYPPLPHVLLWHLHPSASYLIVFCSLPSMRHGRLRASLIDGNNAYVTIEEIGIRECMMCTISSPPSSDPPPTHRVRLNQINTASIGGCLRCLHNNQPCRRWNASRGTNDVKYATSYVRRCILCPYRTTSCVVVYIQSVGVLFNCIMFIAIDVVRSYTCIVNWRQQRLWK